MHRTGGLLKAIVIYLYSTMSAVLKGSLPIKIINKAIKSFFSFGEFDHWDVVCALGNVKNDLSDRACHANHFYCSVNIDRLLTYLFSTLFYYIIGIEYFYYCEPLILFLLLHCVPYILSIKLSFLQHITLTLALIFQGIAQALVV